MLCLTTTEITSFNDGGNMKLFELPNKAQSLSLTVKINDDFATFVLIPVYHEHKQRGRIWPFCLYNVNTSETIQSHKEKLLELVNQLSEKDAQNQYHKLITSIQTDLAGNTETPLPETSLLKVSFPGTQ